MKLSIFTVFTKVSEEFKKTKILTYKAQIVKTEK